MNFQWSFYKFHGTGNDFILIDNREERQMNISQVKTWCTPKTGIGADGLILIENDSHGADFMMRYFNADGNEASLCGNGSRCAVAFARMLGIVGDQAIFRAFDGVHQAVIKDINDSSWEVSLQMNDVTEMTVYREGYFLDTGSPHFVVFKKEIPQGDIVDEARKWRYNSRFVEGCNVNFVSEFEDGIFVRTYERGVEEETLSCGTGVTASVLAFVLQLNFKNGNYQIPVYTKGGDLSVSFTLENNCFRNIVLIGPAVKVFMGWVNSEK